ncbi:MAG: DUF4412 domain-containing protein [Deltaproteobacteria bacterium]|nr:DUF4412 domain-containing protein [Deltaproteobacteria bacterium]
MRTALAALSVTLSLPALAADFEGTIEARLTVTSKQVEERGSGTIRMHVGKAGTRMETKMTSHMGEMQMAVLHLRDKPGVTYLVDDQKKLYVEMGGSRSEERDDRDAAKGKVKRLAPEKVAGYECAHALLTDADGDETEIWASKAVGNAEGFWAAMAGEDARESRKNREAARQLREAGIDGWPLKFRTKQRDGQVVTWEAVKVEKRSVPASLLSLSGYKKSDPGAGPMGSYKPSPEAQRQMDDSRRQMEEAMKKMTPEQREQMEKMMRPGRGGVAPEGPDAPDAPEAEDDED